MEKPPRSPAERITDEQRQKLKGTAKTSVQITKKTAKKNVKQLKKRTEKVAKTAVKTAAKTVGKATATTAAKGVATVASAAGGPWGIVIEKAIEKTVEKVATGVKMAKKVIAPDENGEPATKVGKAVNTMTTISGTNKKGARIHQQL